MPAKVVWYGDGYQSTARVAWDYVRALAQRGLFTDRPDEANVVVLHAGLDILEQQPLLQNKYCIGYLVFDADPLSAKLGQPLAKLDEIWTPSRYNQRILQKWHPRVLRVPHIARRAPGFSAQDLHYVKQLIDYDPSCFYLLSVTAVFRARKNAFQLVNAFHAVADQLGHCRLVLKDYGDERSVVKHPQVDWGPGVIHVTAGLTDTQLTALYSLCHLYVSAHHSEGWGLPLADAMLLGVPTVASGYSGNLDFMTPDNSLLVDCDEGLIKPNEVFYPYESNMRWGYPRHDDLMQKILLAKAMIDDGRMQPKVAQARRDIGRFSTAAVGQLMVDYLAQLSL